jgi:hypothetical protein
MMVSPNVAQALETAIYYGAVPPTPTAPPPPSFTAPLPVSYQFQVVEYTDDQDNVVKVELQVQQTMHDQYGNLKTTSGYKPVPRIRLRLPN